MFDKLFRKKNQQPLPPVASPVVPFVQKMDEWLDMLDWYERECSAYVSTRVYSRLRGINDLLRKTRPFLTTYNIRAEEEYLIKATLTSYIPDALNLFNQLPAEERYDGSVADKQLLTQCDNYEKSMLELLESMKQQVERDLDVQTAFVEERFSQSL